MKKVIFFTSVVLMIVLNPSCKKGNDDDMGTKKGTISAKIDGNAFEANATGVITSLFQQVESLTISGIKITNPSENSGQMLMLMFSSYSGNDISTGTYSFNSSDCDILADGTCANLGYGDTEDPNGLSYGSQDISFNVTIDELDYRSGGFIKGTFSDAILFDVDGNSVNVTDGKFNVSIQ